MTMMMMMINIEYYTKTHSYIPMVTLIWISHSKYDAMVAATTLYVVFLYSSKEGTADCRGCAMNWFHKIASA